MKKRALLLGMMLTLAVTSVGCGKKEADANITEPIYEESSEEAVVGDVVDNEAVSYTHLDVYKRQDIR